MSVGEINVAFPGRLGQFQLDASFTVPARGVSGLFGPSGSGKTSILRAIAGLTYFSGGFCSVAGVAWQDGAFFLPAHKRSVGYVFQEASLFPHLSVRDNLLFAANKNPDPILLAETVHLLGLGSLLDRAPQTLSGGERQRVAIGRALMSRPKLMLMDEPLSALDRAAKDEILPFLQRLAGHVGLPIIYISHDMREIERLADHLVLMRAGRVIASGPLALVQADSALPLAKDRDASVTLQARVADNDAGDGLMALAVDSEIFLIPRVAARIGEYLRMHIMAGDVSLSLQAPQLSTMTNAPLVRIAAIQMLNDSEVLVRLSMGAEQDGQQLLARITLRSCKRLALAEGMMVYAQIKGVSLAQS